MQPRTLFLAPLALLVAACGGAATAQSQGAAALSSAGAKQALLTSVATTASQSFLVDMTLTGTFSSTGEASSSLGAALTAAPLTVSVRMAAESLQRLQLTMDTTIAGRAIHVVAVRYDGTTYFSKDGGATFKVATAGGAVPQNINSYSALEYLQAVGAVTDDGPSTVDGAPVERYTAQLDAAKIVALIKAQLSAAQSAEAQTIFNALTFKAGAIHATVDHQGRVVTVNGPIDVSIGLGAILPRYAGSTVGVQEVIDAHFHGYGSTVTVTKPAVAAT